MGAVNGGVHIPRTTMNEKEKKEKEPKKKKRKAKWKKKKGSMQ